MLFLQFAVKDQQEIPVSWNVDFYIIFYIIEVRLLQIKATDSS